MDMEKYLIRAIVHLARHKEFYGHVIQQFQKVYVEDKHRVDTACVSRMPGEKLLKLYLCKPYFKKLLDEVGKDQGWTTTVAAIEHEALHVVFGHLFLRFEDHLRGNVAVDCVVNSCISKDDLHSNWVHPDDYDFPESKSAMWYYTHLKDNPKFKQQCESGAFGADGIMSWIMSSHDWKDIEEDGFAQEFMKDVVRKAKDMCGRNYGNIPGQVVEQIEDLLKSKRPVVPWARVLRMFCATSQESVLDWTLKRKSKRFGTRPGTRKGDVLNLAVIVDTSGSI